MVFAPGGLLKAVGIDHLVSRLAAKRVGKQVKEKT
jgi:hypothetical protein